MLYFQNDPEGLWHNCLPKITLNISISLFLPKIFQKVIFPCALGWFAFRKLRVFRLFFPPQLVAQAPHFGPAWRLRSHGAAAARTRLGRRRCHTGPMPRCQPFHESIVEKVATGNAIDRERSLKPLATNQWKSSKKIKEMTWNLKLSLLEITSLKVWEQSPETDLNGDTCLCAYMMGLTV